MGILGSVEGWFVGKALVKAVASAAKFIVSFAIAHGIKLIVNIQGVPINTTDEVAMAGAINSGLKYVFATIKNKWPGKFDWLP